jgi:hypothetical protein
MADPIVVKKENDGDTINFFEESSDESDIQLSRKRRIKKRAQKVQQREPIIKVQQVQESHQGQVHNKPQQVPQMARTTLNDNMFEVFTNPDKKRIPAEESDGGSDGMEPEPYGGFNDFEEHDDNRGSEDSEQGGEYYEQPSNGYNSIEDEKQDLLYKFYRLTSKGVPVGKKFNMQSDIREMRSEFNRIQRDSEVKSSIRFSRRMLMACVTGIEFLNKRYDPFDVKLEGWSESVMENMDDYDNVFERLHDKYASKVSMAPEIELLLSLAGSAFMFHLTNSMFNSLPNIKDIAKQNPDILKNMMQSMSAAAASNNREQTNTTEVPSEKREMKPPAIDMSSLFGMMAPGGGGALPVGNASFPVPSRTTDIKENNTMLSDLVTKPNHPVTKPVLKRADSGSSIVSSLVSSAPELSDLSRNNITKIVSVDTSQSGVRRGRKRNKITSTAQNTISI